MYYIYLMLCECVFLLLRITILFYILNLYKENLFTLFKTRESSCYIAEIFTTDCQNFWVNNIIASLTDCQNENKTGGSYPAIPNIEIAICKA